MASLEAKIRGEKKNNYASSSEDEDEEINGQSLLPPPQMDGMPQTGPKGVLNDYRRFQEEEFQKKVQQEKEKQGHIANTVPIVKPRSEETDGGTRELMEALEQIEMDSDPFLQQYRAQRLQEMKEQAKAGNKRKIFGNLTEIRGDKYASTIDSAPSNVFLIIHIYDEFFLTCTKLNRCLTELAKMYPTVKFCRVQSHQLGLSQDFLDKGLPALLVYKGGELVGNLLRITDSLGEDFSTNDVEVFLHDKNCLPSAAEAKVMSSYNLSPRPSLTKQTSDTDDD